MKSKKKFACIVATILAISCMFSSVPVEAGDAEIFHDESAEGQTNLALNCEYSGDYLDNIGSNYPDSGFKELTDGIIGSTTNFYDPDYVGIAGGRANLIVDFGYDQTFNSLTLHYIVKPSASINPPKNVTVSYSKDKVNWTEFGTGGVSSENERNQCDSRFVQYCTRAGLYRFPRSRSRPGRRFDRRALRRDRNRTGQELARILEIEKCR